MAWGGMAAVVVGRIGQLLDAETQHSRGALLGVGLAIDVGWRWMDVGPYPRCPPTSTGFGSQYSIQNLPGNFGNATPIIWKHF